MAEATAVSGRLDTDRAVWIIVVGSVVLLAGFHKLVLNLKG